MEAYGTEHKNQIMKALEEKGFRPRERSVQNYILAGSQSPADIASGRIAEVRSRSMSCNCMTRTCSKNAEAFLNKK